MNRTKVETIHPDVAAAILANVQTDDQKQIITLTITLHNLILTECTRLLGSYGTVSPNSKRWPERQV
jgi:AICAR transformylase/IMP cyclohydrolase PurH